MNPATNPLFELYKLSAQFGPEISRLGGRLKRVVFEVEGREITFSHDEREYPVPDATLPKPPPPPYPIPPGNPPAVPAEIGCAMCGISRSPEGACPNPNCVDHIPGYVARSVTPANVQADDYLPIPPAPEDTSSQILPTGKPKRTDPVEGVIPLTDEDPCPVGKPHIGKRMSDVPADFLDWIYGQPWFRKKYPAMWAYVVRHQDVISEELQRLQNAR